MIIFSSYEKIIFLQDSLSFGGHWHRECDTSCRWRFAQSKCHNSPTVLVTATSHPSFFTDLDIGNAPSMYVWCKIWTTFQCWHHLLVIAMWSFHLASRPHSLQLPAEKRTTTQLTVLLCFFWLLLFLLGLTGLLVDNAFEVLAGQQEWAAGEGGCVGETRGVCGDQTWRSQWQHVEGGRVDV